MAQLMTKPDTQWGVRHAASPAPDHVDPRRDRGDAEHWLAALAFCGNRDAVLVVDEGAGWHTTDEQGGAA